MIERVDITEKYMNQVVMIRSKSFFNSEINKTMWLDDMGLTVFTKPKPGNIVGSRTVQREQSTRKHSHQPDYRSV